MRAIEREEIDTAYSGDICAVVGVKDVITGDTLCDEDFDIRLEPPSFPEPVISMSIEPNSKADQEKLGNALQRLVAEDPTLRVKTDQDTGQTILAGMGELHLEIIIDRMKREFKVEATSGKPQIAYRETITIAADGEGKFIRQSGGKGQYGHVVVKMEPNEKGKGVEVINETVGGSIPKEFIKPATDGILEAPTTVSSPVPGRRRHRPHRRRFVPRGRLLRNGVQDGRHLRVQGCDEEGLARSCLNPSWASRSPPRKSIRAT
jgi:elongation factor G